MEARLKSPLLMVRAGEEPALFAAELRAAFRSLR